MADPYKWHRDALAGKKPQITHEPEAGWFKRRMVRGGPWVPARIWWEAQVDENGEVIGDDVMRCEVDGRRRDAMEEWTYLAGNPISREEFMQMTASAFVVDSERPASTNLPF